MEEIKIYKYQLVQIKNALRLVKNMHNCETKETSFDRIIMEAIKHVDETLNN